MQVKATTQQVGDCAVCDAKRESEVKLIAHLGVQTAKAHMNIVDKPSACAVPNSSQTKASQLEIPSCTSSVNRKKNDRRTKAERAGFYGAIIIFKTEGGRG